MTEQVPNFDEDLEKKFSQLLEEEGDKIKKETILQLVIKELEIFIERHLEPDMPLHVVQEIVDVRLEDLEKGLATTKPGSREFTETTEFINQAKLLREVLKNPVITSEGLDTRIDMVLAKLKATIEDLDKNLTEDEEKKRDENGKNKW